MHTPTLIIGAGLTGLTAAYALHEVSQEFMLLEARTRPGGRILTARNQAGGPLELGATWLGQKHSALVSLLDRLGLGTFEQVTGGRAVYEAISTSPPQIVELPHNDQPSYRIAGGSDALIDTLRTTLPESAVRYGTVVSSVSLTDDRVSVSTSTGTFSAARLITTLPPNLLVSSIAWTPALPESLVQTARRTQTWMAESIKVGLRYAHPFWREDGRPGGTIFSNVGPVSEMYDHTDVTGSHHSLKGFLNGTYFSLSRAERRDLVLHQLRKYYGDVVDGYTAYEEAVWRNEPFTFAPNDGHTLPHQNNGHPVFRAEYFGGRLIIGGSETAVQFPGYMDGAVRSGLRCAELVDQSGL